jgi:hypothetical protein
MIKKEDLKVTYKKNNYRVAVKKTFLKFFYRWETLTWKEEDNITRPIEFNSYKDAISFIETVSD